MTERANKFAGKCRVCGQTVEAGAGLLTGRPGAWTVQHAAPKWVGSPVSGGFVGGCPEKVEAPAPVEAVADPERGVYVTATGQLVRVQLARGSRKAYGLTWHARGGHSGEWKYEGRAILAQIVRPISAEEAALFGHDAGQCVFCSLSLDDDRSVAMGYGPVCARNYGLPWGNKRQAVKVPGKAEAIAESVCGSV